MSANTRPVSREFAAAYLIRETAPLESPFRRRTTGATGRLSRSALPAMRALPSAGAPTIWSVARDCQKGLRQISVAWHRGDHIDRRSRRWV